MASFQVGEFPKNSQGLGIFRCKMRNFKIPTTWEFRKFPTWKPSFSWRFFVTLLSPSWRSLNLWKGHLTIPKRSLWITWFRWTMLNFRGVLLLKVFCAKKTQLQRTTRKNCRQLQGASQRLKSKRKLPGKRSDLQLENGRSNSYQIHLNSMCIIVSKHKYIHTQMLHVGNIYLHFPLNVAIFDLM